MGSSDKRTLNMASDEDIDVVITWVDGSDPDWIREKNIWLGKELSESDIDAESNRYRDWDNLQYIFRGIEVFMPWVRKVHLVTNGQKPSWLNMESSKLELVKHEDFIPSEYLPLFSSTAIEVNLHRIKGLADKFIYFNDDMFVMKPQKSTDWFKNGLPLDQFGLMRAANGDYSVNGWHINFNVIGIINRNVDKVRLTKKYLTKYFSLKNGILFSILSALYYPPKFFPGFIVSHQPSPLLKRSFQDMWEREYEVLHATSGHKFRNAMDVNQYLMKIWQLVNGDFVPKNWYARNHNYISTDSTYLGFGGVIKKNKYDLICIGDEMHDKFDDAKQFINSQLDSVLPNKSEFEI